MQCKFCECYLTKLSQFCLFYLLDPGCAEVIIKEFTEVEENDPAGQEECNKLFQATFKEDGQNKLGFDFTEQVACDSLTSDETVLTECGKVRYTMYQTLV